MIYWYSDLYMDEKVKKNPEKCKKSVMNRRLFRKSYTAIVLAMNEKNLFEIIETRELFFRRYSYLDIYVVGLASNKDEALSLLQQLLLEVWKEDSFASPRKYFDKNCFF